MQDPPDAAVAGSQELDGSRDAICLCTPTPKIPRPRNAFILYRQHHQARVTADNPKLSNPNVSRIIGDMWKKEAEEEKQKWKDLAEEEKQRHQKEFPHYRYQPRRGSKTQGSFNTSVPADEQVRCPKCNGRAIAQVHTPSTPNAQSPAGKPRAATHGQQLGMQRRNSCEASSSRRSSNEQSPTSVVPFPPKLPPVQQISPVEPLSPGVKRRRADAAGSFHPILESPQAYSSASAASRHLSLTPSQQTSPTHLQAYARMSLPEPGTLGGPSPRRNMPPPTIRPSPSTPWLCKDQQSRRKSLFDESLRLPPLQSALTSSRSRVPLSDPRRVSLPLKDLVITSPTRATAKLAKAGEERVMSIPLEKKLAVLATICQTVPPTRKRHGERSVRGAFIAVEGSDNVLLQQTGEIVERILNACNNVALKVWSEAACARSAVKENGENQPPWAQDEATMPETAFELCLEAIAGWQRRSKQIRRHITGKPAVPSGAAGRTLDAGGPGAAAAPGGAYTRPEDDTSAGLMARTPVALAKRGFSLTLSDSFACSQKPLDRYTPEEHWHWMATLWRGTVCPDLIVYVMPSNDADVDETRVRRNVELSRRMGLIVVKVTHEKGLDEALERRLAFELMEWVREGSFRVELPPNWRSESP